MLPAPDGRQGVWERVRINLGQVIYWVRPDCTCETARGFYLLSRLTGAPGDHEIARHLLAYVKGRQYPFGAFPFYDFAPPAGIQAENEGNGPGIWPNDNGKVLCALADLAPGFPELGLETVACAQADYFVQNQKPEGWWNLDKTDYPGTCFVTWPLAALSKMYKLTGREAYRTAACKALTYLQSLQQGDGRMRTSYEINKVENWRPVSSESAMALYAYSVAQDCLGVDLSARIQAVGDFVLSLVSAPTWPTWFTPTAMA
jgi:hypothetical protein